MTIVNVFFAVGGIFIGFFIAIIAFSKKDNTTGPDKEPTENIEFKNFAEFSEFARNMPVGKSIEYDGSENEGSYFLIAKTSGGYIVITQLASSTAMATVFIENGKL